MVENLFSTWMKIPTFQENERTLGAISVSPGLSSGLNGPYNVFKTLNAFAITITLNGLFTLLDTDSGTDLDSD